MKLFQKTIEYLFYLYVFLLPWQTRLIWRQGMINGGPWEYGTFSLYATEFLLILVLILGFIWLIFNRETKKRAGSDFFGFYLWIFILILASFISTYWAPDYLLALYAFIKLMEGMGLLALAIRIKFTFKRLALALTFAALIQSILAIYQFLNQSVIGNKWLGISEQSSASLGPAIVETITSRWLRAYGSLPHPNILGGFLAIALLMLIGLAFVSQKKIERFFILISFTLINAALFLTFSRESWLAYVLALAFLFYIIFKGQNQRLKIALADFLVITLVVGACFGLFFKAEFFTRLRGSGRLELKSTEERIDYYDQSYKF